MAVEDYYIEGSTCLFKAVLGGHALSAPSSCLSAFESLASGAF